MLPLTVSYLWRKGPNCESLVCKLTKSLYRLKQSGRNWNGFLHGYLTQEGFIQSLAVPCVSVTELGQVIAIVLIDDIIIAGSNTDVLKKAEESLMMRFKMKNLGVLSWFLGIQFKCENNGIDMSQSKFVERILERFNMSHWKPKAVPCELGAKRSQYTVNESEFENVNLYRETVGSLIYLKTCARPDFCYVVTYLYQNLHHRVCGSFILHYGFWFTFNAATHPVCMKMFRSKAPTLVGRKLIRVNGSIWLGFTNKLPNFESTETLGQPAPAFTEPSVGFTLLLCWRHFH